jgi:hypothetical protein
MPSMLATAAGARTRPSADAPVPVDVTDVMLWRLAFDVAVEHQQDRNGYCTNLRCAGQRGPCQPAVHAQQALQAARRPATPAPPQPDPAPPIVAGHTPLTNPRRTTAVGRAPVVQPNAGRFTGWFTHTPATAVGRWRVNNLPQRTPFAALAAA